MKQNFDFALSHVLVHEGGYVNHPADPGGATNKGITFRVYNAWRDRQGLPHKDVRFISNDEVAAIYKAQYWDAVQGDALPSGLDYAVFDFAVNSGPSRAAKFLQAVVGAAQDGQIGQLTLQAVAKRDAATVAAALCDNRLAWLKRLKTWSTFGKGWGRRVAEVKAAAVEMAGGGKMRASFLPDIEPPAVTGKATGGDRVTVSIVDAIKDPASLGAAAAVLGAGGALAEGTGPVQWAIAAVLVMAAFAGLVLLVRKIKEN